MQDTQERDRLPRARMMAERNDRTHASKRLRESSRKDRRAELKEWIAKLQEPSEDHRKTTELREKLHRALVHWAKEDLQAASDFIEGSILAKKGNFWMTGVLRALGESNPQQAFAHGLKLNAEREKYTVNPEALLEMATLYLGAKEVVVAMSQTSLTGSPSEVKCLYPGDTDFQKIGDAIVAKHLAVAAEGKTWQPSVMPMNFVTTWAAKDAAAAYDYCVKMNPLHQDGVGKEWISYALGTSGSGGENAAQALNALLQDETLKFDRDELACEFVTCGAEFSVILLDALSDVPDEARDLMGQAAMDRVTRNEMGPQTGEIAACLKVMVGDEARFSAVKFLANEYIPKYAEEAVQHLRGMGYRGEAFELKMTTYLKK